MSEKEILEEIKNIFLKLTEGEPTPDDEIEAREKLIEAFKILRDENLIHDKADLIEDTINKLENWDTLDLWFKEVDGLVANIERDYQQRLFEYRNIGPYNGNPDSLFSSTNYCFVLSAPSSNC